MSGGIKAKDESVESHDEYGKRGPNDASIITDQRLCTGASNRTRSTRLGFVQQPRPSTRLCSFFISDLFYRFIIAKVLCSVKYTTQDVQLRVFQSQSGS